MALHNTSLRSKLETFPYLLQMILYVFPKMKYFEIKNFYGGDKHMCVQLVGNLIKMKTPKKTNTKII